MPRPTAPGYVLGLLTSIYVLNFVDRQILATLLEPVRRAFDASDTVMGLLTGPAFALFYTVLGLPLARLADRTRRRDVIAAGLLLWSAATTLTGAATGLGFLLACRIAVGVGEAACTPPAHSLLASLYAPARRTTALAVYGSGIYLGLLLGNALPGWLAAWWGWRTAFVVVGLPGVLLALLLRLTVTEPPRAGPPPGPVLPTLLGFARHPVLRHVALAAGLASVAGYAHLAWDVTFLMRAHGFDTGAAGTFVGLGRGLGGALGMLLGGWLADRLGRRRPAARARVAQGGVLLAALPTALFLLAPTWPLAFAAYVPAALLAALYLAPVFGLVQLLAPPPARALAAAVLLFVMNFMGLGLGPPLVGRLADLFRPRAGLREALLLVTGAYLGAALLFGRAARHLARPSGSSRADPLGPSAPGAGGETGARG